MAWWMAIPALAAAGASIYNTMSSNSEAENQKQAMKEAMGKLNFNPEDFYAQYKYYDDPLLYQTYLQGNTEFDNVNVDPNVLAAQNDALNELINLSEAKGLNAIDQQALQEITNAENINLKGQQDAIMQNAMERGVYGSGLELANRLQAAQSAANRMNNQDMDIMSQAQQRALEALSGYGNLSTQMRNQSFNEQAERAKAQDAINQYNINNMKETDRGNVDLRNDVSQKNTDIYNKQQDSNVDSAQSIFNNKKDIAALETNQYATNQNATNEKRKANNELIGTLATSAAALSGSGK